MAPLDDIKKLLDGTLDPSVLESQPELYEMAESIYGRDALDEMGVEAPERPPDTIIQPNGDSKHEVQMPTPQLPLPEPEPMKEKKRNWAVFGIAFLIFSILTLNLVVGIGAVVPLCDSPDSSTPCEDKMILGELPDYESTDSWTEPLTFDVIDGVLIVISMALMAFGLRKR